ncbi:hypothetical protein [Agrobacterium vitis]|uniref:hypothetical protein n=1 Tax=Agrobacterium vitis TaxID=373 RepID=UPI00148D6D72|nr:hypothetical protein [Agrobacterium vitis]NOJ37917.1 hypothetical protein [Agrobacterium vitis]NSY15242.1 hypothetical protein [Agrobacterium vitis]NSY24999.1 hypothetical protein [Agrobacterium vitis]NTA24531.1 hypothetical protein [Agrobacterium vitis]WEO74752.1 hypothetical protein G6L01_024905 [Agrobacterium vitis]
MHINDQQGIATARSIQWAPRTPRHHKLVIVSQKSIPHSHAPVLFSLQLCATVEASDAIGDCDFLMVVMRNVQPVFFTPSV